MRTPLITAIATATLLAAGSAHAQEINKTGTLILSADRVLGYSSSIVTSETTDVSGNSAKNTDTTNDFSVLFASPSAALIPVNVGGLGGIGGGAGGLGGLAVTVVSPFTLPRASIDFVVADGFTVGGSFGINAGGGSREFETATATRSTDKPSRLGFSFAPRAGYLAMFNEDVGIWPRAGFTFYLSRSTSSTTDGSFSTETVVTHSGSNVDLELPLVVTLSDFLFVHLGPVLDIPLSGSGKLKTTTSNGDSMENEFDAKIMNIGVAGGVGGNL